MPTLLRINYNYYLVKNEAAVVAALKALAGAVRMEAKHIKVGGKSSEVFWPDEHQTNVGMETVLPEQIFRTEPDEADVAVSASLKKLSGGQMKLIA